MVSQPQVEEIERTIRARDAKIQEVKENMNNVEDVVFRGFCRDIGVANIRSLSFLLWSTAKGRRLTCWQAITTAYGDLQRQEWGGKE